MYSTNLPKVQKKNNKTLKPNQKSSPTGSKQVCLAYFISDSRYEQEYYRITTLLEKSKLQSKSL